MGDPKGQPGHFSKKQKIAPANHPFLPEVGFGRLPLTKLTSEFQPQILTGGGTWNSKTRPSLGAGIGGTVPEIALEYSDPNLGAPPRYLGFIFIYFKTALGSLNMIIRSLNLSMFSVNSHWDHSIRFRWNMIIAVSGRLPLLFWVRLAFGLTFGPGLFSVPMERGTKMEQPGTLEVVQR